MTPRPAAPSALFVGLCTLDIIHSVAHVPGPDEKVTALRQTVAAGGPATGAAVTFAHLGGHATLLTGVGAHPLAGGIHADLRLAGVALVDAADGDTSPPPVSSIMVTAGSGDRSVVSLNAAGRAFEPPAGLDALVSSVQTVLVDAHHGELALAAARAARARRRLCILDGGSWQDSTLELVSHVDVAICSADFHPPGIPTPAGTLDYLLQAGVSWAAITNGAGPVSWATRGARSQVTVPAVTAVDTLGAGDVFHGAFAYAISGVGDIDQAHFVSALGAGARTAALSCQSFGTRTWMRAQPGRA